MDGEYNFLPEEILDAIHDELLAECWWDALAISKTWQEHKKTVEDGA